MSVACWLLGQYWRGRGWTSVSSMHLAEFTVNHPEMMSIGFQLLVIGLSFFSDGATQAADLKHAVLVLTLGQGSPMFRRRQLLSSHHLKTAQLA